MPTQILRPLATGTFNAWGLGAGATKMAAVDTGDPVSHDDDTTYITNNETNNRQSFTLTPIPVAGIVNTVSMASRARVTSLVAGNSMDDGVNIGATVVSANTYALAATAYVTMGPTGVARPGGGAWQGADLYVLEMNIRASAGAATVFRGTSLWVVVDYLPPAGGFAFLLSGLLPLIGGGLLLAEMPRLRAMVNRINPDFQLGPGDDLPAWRDLRAYRRPHTLRMA